MDCMLSECCQPPPSKQQWLIGSGPSTQSPEPKVGSAGVQNLVMGCKTWSWGVLSPFTASGQPVTGMFSGF
jgi:hypothetical protein